MSATDRVQRFREFELDRAAHELRRRGRPVRLEGRAMSLLMLLLEHPGELVSRAEIVTRLWGSDAFIDVESGINTAVRKLRSALRDHADDPKIVRTVQGKGYRFIAPLEAGAADPAASAATDAARPAGARWVGGGFVLRGLAVAIAVVAVAVLVIAVAPRPAVGPRVQVMPLTADGGRGAAAFAERLDYELTGALNDTGVQTSPPPKWVLPSLRRKPPDLVFGGAVSEAGGVATVRLFLEDSRADLTLWTRELAGPADHHESLAEQAAAASSEAIYSALEPQQQRGLQVDPRALASYIRGAELFKIDTRSNPGSIRRAFEETLRRSPNFAMAHGQLAMALEVEAERAPSPEREALLARAEAEANTAIRIDPANGGRAYNALGLLERRKRPDDIWAMERHTRDGLAAAPDYPFFSMRECQILTAVGRFKAATTYCQRALALRPMAKDVAVTYAALLTYSGQYAAARVQFDRLDEIDPANLDQRFLRYFVAALSGSPAEASRIAHDPQGLLPFLSPEQLKGIDLNARARTTRAPADVDRAEAWTLRLFADRKMDLGQTVTTLAYLGRQEAALDLLARGPAERLPDNGGSRAAFPDRGAFLVQPLIAPLWDDDRFWLAAARTGLVQYWVTTRTWPDFCSDPARPIDCAGHVARATQGRLTAVDVQADGSGPLVLFPHP